MPTNPGTTTTRKRQAASTTSGRRRCTRVSLSISAFAVLGIQQARAQGTWTQFVDVGARHGHAMAYDIGRQRAVMFGGFGAEGTWEWDGTSWTRLSVVGPPPRHGHGMAYDAIRGRVVLFGGFGLLPTSPPFADTWEWDGSVWTNPAQGGPPPRGHHAMTFDLARGRVLVYGGADGMDSHTLRRFGDTWEWNGASWTLVTSQGPSPRAQVAMACDEARSRTVLFGGHGGAFLGDTWELVGATWTQVSLTGPVPRYGHAMTYDAVLQKVILYSGGQGSGIPPFFPDDTWSWDGQTWTRIPAVGPRGRRNHGLVHDRARGVTVVYGGWQERPRQSVVASDTWTLSTGAWTLSSQTSPPGAYGHAMAFDSARARTVMFGGYGLDETWEWDGSRWWLAGTVGPSPRGGHAMAYDASRRRVVLCGGSNDYPSLGDETWEWDGTTWTPAARFASGGLFWHGMTYNSDRRRIVLFTTTSSGYRGLWEWDGAAWAYVAPDPLQTQRTVCLAYDEARHRVVVSSYAATIEWDGSVWHSFPSVPGPRSFAAIVYDSARQRVISYGGTSDRVNGFGDTWEWDGSTWRMLAQGTPVGRFDHAMAYDSVRERVTLFGGNTGSSYGADHASDTWEWAPRVQSAITPIGVGCPGRTGIPVLGGSGRPVIGNQRFAVEVRSLPAYAVTFLGFSATQVNQVVGPCTIYPQLPFMGTLLIGANSAGLASFGMPIPWDMNLAGQSFFMQGGALDPGAALLGLASLTPGARFAIGD